MKKTYLTLAVSLALFSLSLSAYADETAVLEEVKVIAKSQEAFKQAGAVAIRGEEKQMQSLDSVVRALPGSYTNIDPTQGTLNVNIRGMSGFGRVNTTVDGVPQTLFGTSSNGNSRFHDAADGASSPTSQFGTAVDANLLAEIKLDKGFAHGASGVNSLAGSAELKTLDIDDILSEGKQVGVRSKFAVGNNAYGYNGMIAVAGKQQAFSRQGNIGAIFAQAWRTSSPNYKNGNGTRHTDNPYVLRQDQKPRSWIGKVEANLSEQTQLKLSGQSYETNIGGRRLENRQYALAYRFNGDSPLVNLSALASHTKNRQIYNPDAAVWTFINAASHNRSNYFKLDNESFIEFDKSSLALTVGASRLINSYYRSADFDETQTDTDRAGNTPFAPSGKQKISAVYLNGEYKRSIYTLNTGLTYTHTAFTGFKPACGQYEGVQIPCFPQGDAHIRRSESSFNPSVMLSADFHEAFSPFVSYAKSKRMPNIQEVFFNNEGGGSMNPYLKSESASTYQIGFNSVKHGLFGDNDHFGAKVVYYRSKINNFITSEKFWLNNGNGERTQDLSQNINPNYAAQIAINAAKPVKTGGAEVELNYDSDHFFSRLSYSYQKTSQPIGVQAGVDGFGYGDIYELPKHYASLDIGTHLLNKKLTLGTILKYHGTVYRILPRTDYESAVPSKQKLPSRPVTADFYAGYEFNPHFSLKFSVQNAFNAAYIDPLNSQNAQQVDYDVDENDNDVFKFSNYARGRTYLIGGEIRF